MASPQPVPALCGAIVTAAIDFGTFSSGYAFAFRHEPLQIYTNAWYADGATLARTKAPTAVLFDTAGDFHSFGFEAEEHYSNLIDDEEEVGWSYFENFKMELYKEESLSRDTTLADNEGKRMPALKIFAESIRYLKQKLFDDVRSSLRTLQDDDILWILTVPAIWSEPAKQFMREAANQAGIDNCRLRLVLEPEAASVFCQANCTLRNVQSGGKVKLEPFPVNHTYIIADLGGGTADIATHEVLTGGNLRELYRATGGALGATQVNRQFVLFLEQIFGADVIANFRSSARGQYMDLLRDFESKKKKVKVNNKEPMRLKWPSALTECIQKKHRKTPANFIRDSNCGNILIFKRDKVQVSPTIVDVFFKQLVDDIVSKLTEILRNQENAIDSLLLVGGFADSLYLRERIKQDILQQSPGINIVKPEEADLHVLKGAALTTIRPTAISERISPYVYGLRTSERFDARKHPPNSKEARGSGVYFADIFKKCIDKGQILKNGARIKERFEGQRYDMESKTESCSIELYRASKPDTKYTFENGCERVAKIVIKPPKEGWPNCVVFDVEIDIGETQLHITVISGSTGEMLNASVDFLGN